MSLGCRVAIVLQSEAFGIAIDYLDLDTHGALEI
jgi:hypothetical protein